MLRPISYEMLVCAVTEFARRKGWNVRMAPAKGQSWHGLWVNKPGDKAEDDLAFLREEPSPEDKTRNGGNAAIYCPRCIWVHRDSSKAALVRCFIERAGDRCTHGFFMRFREGYLNEIKNYMGGKQKTITEITDFLNVLEEFS